MPGVAFEYEILTTKFPNSYGATPLPDGLTINTETGIISGVPTTIGSTLVTVSATDAAGTGSAALVIVVTVPPVITSSLTANGATGTSFTYQIVASQSPTSYSAIGLPSGLTLNPSTGLISGTPAAAATTNVTINATNAAGTGSATLVITIAATAPLITS